MRRFRRKMPRSRPAPMAPDGRKPRRSNSRRLNSRRRLNLEKLAARELLAADLVISEFLASNSGGLEDEDGDSSDWIEIHNPTDAPINLAGWTLTDDVDAPEQWTFPDVTLAAQDYLVVFASSKDRVAPSAPLHTNFRLTGGGEYLGLLRPDGTIASAYAPTFPEQIGNVSYGMPFRNDLVIETGDSIEYFVPSDGSLGQTWQQPSFDASGWDQGPGGIGFGIDRSGFEVTYYKARPSGGFNGVVNSLALANDLISTPAYQQTVVTERVDVVNYLGSGGGANFPGDRAFPTQSIGDDINQFAIHATSAVTIPAPGNYTFGVNSDDGFQLNLSGPGGSFASQFDGTRAPANTLQTFFIPVAGSYDLELLFFEAGGGSSVELFAAAGSHNTFDAGVFDLVGDVDAGGLTATVPYVAGESDVVATDIESAMRGVNSTVYARLPFTVDRLDEIDSLILDVLYDDGWAASLNGVPIASANAPTTLAFDSAATQARSADEVTTPDRLILSGAALSALQVGENVLAIQGLNASVGDTSYLLSAEMRVVGVDESQQVFLADPTPGGPNGEGAIGLVGSVEASVAAGFYETPQTVSLVTPTAGATIRYTLDGSDPSATNGIDYVGPITVASSTNLRATAVRDDYLTARSNTWTYLFLDDVLTQSTDGTPPPGFPATWNTNVVDYGVDPDVIATEGADVVKDALRSIPTWSITTDVDHLFGSETGIYSNALQDGRDWERPASVELILPDGSEGFQINAGLRIRGGFSRNDFNPKHAFRLFFRNEYGGDLQYPVHGADSADTFDKIDLRTPQNYSWSSGGDASNQFIAEYIARKNQAELGQPATQSAWLHLYLNGQYWGLYQTQERAEANFAETYFGGDADDYDVIKPERGPYQNIATDGNMDAYDRLFQQALARAGDGITPAFVDNGAYMAAQGLNPDGTENPAYETLLDVDNLIVYMIEIFRGGNFDAPISKFLGNNRINNYFAIRDRTGNEGFRFFIHDSEHSLRNLDGTDRLQVDRVGPFNHPNFESSVNYFNPQWLHQQLMANEEYRLRFADHVQRAFFGDGPLTAENQIASWQAEADVIDLAVIGESLRWGDARSFRADNPLGQSHYRNAIADIRDNYLPFRNANLINQFRGATLQLADGNGGYSTTVAAPLFPDLGAPELAIDGTLQPGGVIEPGANLSLLASDLVYYTVDGTDPRVVGGGIAAGAIAYDPNVITQTVLPTGAAWRYDDSGSDLATAWRSPGFDDSAWAVGNAELGYGDGDEATVISFGGNPNDKHITTYFRNTFEIGSADIDEATIRVRRDDGVVVFVNGVEVARDNLPGGAIGYQTTATTPLGGTDETNFLEFAIDPALLVVGTNSVAVEIHQANSTSSDISFDAEIRVESRNAPDIPLPDSTTIHARTRSSDGTWSPLVQADFVVPRTPADASNLRISEIHYHPSVDGDAEFIELENTTSGTQSAIISLAGVSLTEGPNAPLTLGQSVTLGPGEYALIVKDIAAFTAAYPDVDPALIVGDYSGSLRNSGEQILLLDATGETIADIEYDDSDPWTKWADGPGGSLVAVDAVQIRPDGSVDPDRIDKSYAWRGSTLIHGSPGAADPPRSGVVINEILAHTDAPLVDSIELFNPTNNDIDISGWFLSDDDDQLDSYVIPAGTILASGGYWVFDESDFNPTPLTPGPGDFALSGSQGETVWLTIPGPDGGVGAIADEALFDATFNGVSVGRTPDSGSRMLPLDSLTLGSANSAPRSFGLVITEVHYHPNDPTAAALVVDPTLTDGDLEFVEITNRSDAEQALLGHHLGGRSTFAFSATQSLAAGESLLLVPFDPDAPINVNRRDAFRVHHGIDASIPLAGPFTPGLSNSESLVRLLAPDDAPVDEPTVMPRVLIDEALYDDLDPWPSAADGTGDSLQRVSDQSNGNQAGSWRAAAPTPGTTRYVPMVESVLINQGTPTRSEVTSIEIRLSEEVQTPDPSAFEIVNTDTQSIVGNVQVAMQVSDGRSILTLTFGDAPQVDVRTVGQNTLVDGAYQLTIRGDQLVAAIGSAPGDGDEVYGDDPLDRFYRKYGDVDGNGSVELFDFGRFRGSFGAAIGDAEYQSDLDANGNGTIDLFDFGRFRGAFGS